VVVSGFHPVREILERRPKSVEALLVQKGRRDARTAEIEALAREGGVPVRIVPREELDRIAGKAHNGLAVRVAVREYDPVEKCLDGPKGERVVLFLDEVTDPGNLGAVLRSAAALGAAVVVPERHAAPLSDVVVKASAGAIERVRIGRVGNASRFLADAKEAGFWVFGADATGEPVSAVDLTGDVLVCLGSEGEGMRRLTREGCDRLVSIPMTDGAGSLNVSVAAGILLYEIRRQRGGKGSPGTKMA
jgi:23S rRNA (guanosine2251-2'-O)-methyltransferase